MFQNAAAARRAVSITYSSTWARRVATRTIHPYQVVSTSRGYEVDAGPLDDHDQPRSFLLNGIRGYQVLDEAFTVPAQAADAIATRRQFTPVTRVALQRGMWAVRHGAERVDHGQADSADVACPARLPPLPERVALICSAARPGIEIDVGYGRWVGVAREPVPFEVYEAGVYLHGTKASLGVGDLLVPGRESNFEDGRRMNYVYFTATLDAAVWGAELASGVGRGRIYLVEPTGPFEDDPNVTDKKFPGNPTQSFRSRAGLRVVGELADWVGHPEAKLQAMRDGLEALKRRGEAHIDD